MYSHIKIKPSGIFFLFVPPQTLGCIALPLYQDGVHWSSATQNVSSKVMEKTAKSGVYTFTTHTCCMHNAHKAVPTGPLPPPGPPSPPGAPLFFPINVEHCHVVCFLGSTTPTVGGRVAKSPLPNWQMWASAATARTCTAVVCGRHVPLLLLLLMRAVIAGVLGSQKPTMPHYDSAIITLTASITLSYTGAGQNNRQSDTLPSCQLTNLSLGQDHYHHYRTEHFLSAINQGYQ